MSAPEAPPPDKTLDDRLAELDGLRASGVLSDKDYELARSVAVARAGNQKQTASPAPSAGKARWPWLVGGVAVVAIAVIITAVVHASGGPDEPAPPADAPAAAAPPRASTALALPGYNGPSFSIEYPRGFYRETSEEDMGGYFDTTFRKSGTDDTLVRVNQSPGDTVDGRTSALQLEENTSKTPGYRRIGITQTTLDGMPAARWEFLTAPSGRTLRTVNILGNDGSSGWGVMTRAPDRDYARWAPIFKQVRSSFTVTG